MVDGGNERRAVADIDGYLFDNAPPVHILPEAVEVGGSWEGHPQTDPARANDADLIERVYEYLKAIPNPVLVDVGANTGSFSLLPALLPDLTVFAFEPNREVYDILEQHLRMNHVRHRVLPFCEAAWNQHETLLLSIPYTYATGCATLGKPVEYTPVAQQVVEAVPLDDLLDDNPPRIDLIKIDVEGSEKFVLEGAKRLIERYRPIILVEVTWTTGLLFDYPSEQILELLSTYGYRYELVKEGNYWATPL